MTTISRGRIVWHNGELTVEPGSGRFVPTPIGGKLFSAAEGPRVPPWLAQFDGYSVRANVGSGIAAPGRPLAREDL